MARGSADTRGSRPLPKRRSPTRASPSVDDRDGAVPVRPEDERSLPPETLLTTSG